MDDTGALLRFVQRSNDTDLREGEAALRARGRYSELVALYQHRGQHEAGLDLLHTLTSSPQDLPIPPSGTATPPPPPTSPPPPSLCVNPTSPLLHVIHCHCIALAKILGVDSVWFCAYGTQTPNPCSSPMPTDSQDTMTTHSWSPGFKPSCTLLLTQAIAMCQAACKVYTGASIAKALTLHKMFKGISPSFRVLLCKAKKGHVLCITLNDVWMVAPAHA